MSFWSLTKHDEDELRRAIADQINRGGGTVAFGVPGVWDLTSALNIDGLGEVPLVLDGLAAPGPVEIRGHSMFVSKGNVTLRGLVLADPWRNTKDAGEDTNADCLGVYSGHELVENVLVEFCAFMHAVDENVSVFFYGTGKGQNIVFRYNVIAECLHLAGHTWTEENPEGQRHSTGMLIQMNNPGAGWIDIQKNLFVSNVVRNPDITGNSQACLRNNLIVNHSRGPALRGGEGLGPIRAALVGNHIIEGRNTIFATTPPVTSMGQVKDLQPGSQVLIDDNYYQAFDAGGYNRRESWEMTPGPGETGDVTQYLTQDWPLDFLGRDHIDPVETVYWDVLNNAGPKWRRNGFVMEHAAVARIKAGVIDGSAFTPRNREQIPPYLVQDHVGGKTLAPYDQGTFNAADPGAFSGTGLDSYLARARWGLY